MKEKDCTGIIERKANRFWLYFLSHPLTHEATFHCFGVSLCFHSQGPAPVTLPGGLLQREGSAWEVTSHFLRRPWPREAPASSLHVGPLRGVISPPESSWGEARAPSGGEPSCLLSLLCAASLLPPRFFYWEHFLKESLAPESLSQQHLLPGNPA